MGSAENAALGEEQWASISRAGRFDLKIKTSINLTLYLDYYIFFLPSFIKGLFKNTPLLNL